MRACDLCRDIEGVQQIEVAARESEVPEGHVGTSAHPLTEADLCSTCQDAVGKHGIVDGIVTRYASQLMPRERGSALKRLLGDE